MSFCCFCWFFFFKQKTAYEMRISDWSSDVCSSDLLIGYIFSGLCGIGYEGGKKAADEYYRPCTLRIDRGTQLCLAIAKDIAKRDTTQVQLGIICKTPKLAIGCSRGILALTKRALNRMVTRLELHLQTTGQKWP